MRQFAGGDGAVVDQVMIGAGLFNNSAGKGEGSGGSQDHPVAAKAQPSRPGHIVKASRFQIQIVGAVRRANVVVIGTAVEREMSGRGHFLGVGVVGCFVGPQHVIVVVDFNRAVQLVNGTFFFLLNGADGVDVSAFLLRRSRQGAGCCLSGCWFFRWRFRRAASQRRSQAATGW